LGVGKELDTEAHGFEDNDSGHIWRRISSLKNVCMSTPCTSNLVDTVFEDAAPSVGVFKDYARPEGFEELMHSAREEAQSSVEIEVNIWSCHQRTRIIAELNLPLASS